MKYKYLLWDVDGTLLNFKAAERVGIIEAFKAAKLKECTEEMLESYSKINDSYWERLEKGEVDKKTVLIDRFKDFFDLYNIKDVDPVAFNDLYHSFLGETIVYMDNSYELIKSLKDKYKLVIITNGTKSVQERKLSKSGFDKLFEKVYISDVVGYQKPSIEFMTYVKNDLGVKDNKELLIIGDSLTSDIKLGVNSDVDTIWYNPHHKVNNKDIKPTYEVDNLKDVLKIIG